MKITLLCSDEKHPVNKHLKSWVKKWSSYYDVELIRTKKELKGGDFLFLVSCSEIISSSARKKYKYSLLLHASDLPTGRGWSPHIWEILDGATFITLTLLEAEDEIDSGRIWLKTKIPIPKHFLCHEINNLLFDSEIKFINKAISDHKKIIPQAQDLNKKITYYKKRSREESILNPDKSLDSQFDLLRVSDPDRYPALLKMHGHLYKVTLEKIDA